jgi:hypothetical protein
VSIENAIILSINSDATFFYCVQQISLSVSFINMEWQVFIWMVVWILLDLGMAVLLISAHIAARREKPCHGIETIFW